MQIARAASHWDTCRKLGLLQELTAEGIEAVRGCFASERTYAEGEAIVREGDTSDELMLLLDGTARVSWRQQRRISLLRGTGAMPTDEAQPAPAASTRVSRAGGGGGVAKLCSWLQQGDFFGDHSALTGTPRTATVTATSACVVAIAPRSSAQVTRQRCCVGSEVSFESSFVPHASCATA